MSESDRIETVPISLQLGRRRHGRMEVSVVQGPTVLLVDKVDLHDPLQIEAFLLRLCQEFPGLAGYASDLRRQLMQAAVPTTTSQDTATETTDRYIETDDELLLRVTTSDGEILKPLANFKARIRADIFRDDGTEAEHHLEIEATLGGQSHRFIIAASQYNSMNWALEHLGGRAILYPGMGLRDHARAAIQQLSGTIPTVRVFTHTGWREVGGSWFYLHAGGAIGPHGRVDGVQVDLPPALRPYEFRELVEGEELKEAIRATLRRLDLAADVLSVPGFCAPWRAVLGPCDFSLSTTGPTGAFKSEYSALIQQHFGRAMNRMNLPGSWSSTDNALEGLAFSAKDTLLVIDDFAPAGSAHDVARYHQKADRIFRAAGNSAARGRMRPDGTLRPPKPPRGLIVSTGEDTPRGQSCRARMLITEISGGDIPPQTLSVCQQDAIQGQYEKAMAGYIRYLASRYEPLRQNLRAEIEQLRQSVTLQGAHCRTPEIVANLMVGVKYFISFALEVGAMSGEEARVLEQRCWTALLAAAAEQASQQAAHDPAQRFVELVCSALASGRAHLADWTHREPGTPEACGWRRVDLDWRPQGDRIGWIDGEDLYLDPDASYRTVQMMAGPGDGLAISAQTLRTRLAEKGWLIRGRAKELMTRKTRDGVEWRLIHLRTALFLGEAAAQSAKVAQEAQAKAMAKF